MRSFAVVITALAVAACGASSAEEDDGAESGDDALSTFAVTAYTPMNEGRVASADIPTLLGDKIPSGHAVVVTRSLGYAGQDARVVVDAQTYATAIVAKGALESNSHLGSVQDTPFEKSLASLASSHAALEHLDATAPNEGADEPFALTIDMCQSHKPWEKRLFDWIVSHADEIHAPVPIGIAMTGVWAKAHPTELDQLLTWQRSNKLAITWINHSSTHPLHCQDTACRNATFLTDASVDMNEEVLGLERTLVGRGIMPSVVFRFPGLVHDQRRLDQLNKLSLLPIDANAWIAKGEPIKARAVVLVHGNGNEPEGITGFLKQVQTPARAANLRSGKSTIVPPIGIAPAR